MILAFFGPGGGKVDFYAKNDFLVKMTSKSSINDSVHREMGEGVGKVVNFMKVRKI